MEALRFLTITLFLLLVTTDSSSGYEVRKEHLFNSWWDRLMIKIFANKQVFALV